MTSVPNRQQPLSGNKIFVIPEISYRGSCDSGSRNGHLPRSLREYAPSEEATLLPPLMQVRRFVILSEAKNLITEAFSVAVGDNIYPATALTSLAVSSKRLRVAESKDDGYKMWPRRDLTRLLKG
jgi:hypothetical protein